MTLRLTSLALCLLCSLPAHAERADRDKPMLLEANKISIDDAKKVQILEGDVVVTKGTMTLKAERIVVSEDDKGYQKGVAFAGKGGLARFRQKLEGKPEYIDGEAERIEYDTQREIAELFQRAWVRSGQDEVRGDYIWYDAVSEKYLVTAGGKTSDPKSPPGRVRAIIQPRNKDNGTPSSAPQRETLELKRDEHSSAPR
ncbi:MAG: lipopolysaccharide transport periplasmic protein LptA [Dechloromonas sp.]|nr:lipopolysaccharide transport periplasmic protein LptA [Dechloromonas sp.]